MASRSLLCGRRSKPSVSTMYEATAVKSACRGRADDAFSGAGMVSPRSVVSSKRGFLDGGRRGGEAAR
ncbi:hypothetical protein EYF80_032861 [Liparis tanakae]|uniref:Uncharacterized protein n=1 Tax=Liparis tanakae TaxID=230148 RepID=A0A4Z2GU53_9TELE|nr:hypothetical protein EYF80_032861 [Liparis tanakae]